MPSPLFSVFGFLHLVSQITKLLLWRKDVDLVADSVCSGTSLRLRHFLANNHGVAGFGIDAGRNRFAAAGYRVGVLLLGHYTVLDDLRGRRRYLAANWRWRRWGRRRRCCHRLFLGGTARKKQNRKQKQDGDEFFHHAVSRAIAQYNSADVSEPIASGMPSADTLEGAPSSAWAGHAFELDTALTSMHTGSRPCCPHRLRCSRSQATKARRLHSSSC
jgi:hypothetical protein